MGEQRCLHLHHFSAAIVYVFHLTIYKLFTGVLLSENEIMVTCAVTTLIIRNRLDRRGLQQKEFFLPGFE